MKRKVYAWAVILDLKAVLMIVIEKAGRIIFSQQTLKDEYFLIILGLVQLFFKCCFRVRGGGYLQYFYVL